MQNAFCAPHLLQNQNAKQQHAHFTVVLNMSLSIKMLIALLSIVAGVYCDNSSKNVVTLFLAPYRSANAIGLCSIGFNGKLFEPFVDALLENPVVISDGSVGFETLKIFNKENNFIVVSNEKSMHCINDICFLHIDEHVMNDEEKLCQRIQSSFDSLSQFQNTTEVDKPSILILLSGDFDLQKRQSLLYHLQATHSLNRLSFQTAQSVGEKYNISVILAPNVTTTANYTLGTAATGVVNRLLAVAQNRHNHTVDYYIQEIESNLKQAVINKQHIARYTHKTIKSPQQIHNTNTNSNINNTNITNINDTQLTTHKVSTLHGIEHYITTSKSVLIATLQLANTSSSERMNELMTPRDFATLIDNYLVNASTQYITQITQYCLSNNIEINTQFNNMIHRELILNIIQNITPFYHRQCALHKEQIIAQFNTKVVDVPISVNIIDEYTKLAETYITQFSQIVRDLLPYTIQQTQQNTHNTLQHNLQNIASNIASKMSEYLPIIDTITTLNTTLISLSDLPDLNPEMEIYTLKQSFQQFIDQRTEFYRTLLVLPLKDQNRPKIELTFHTLLQSPLEQNNGLLQNTQRDTLIYTQNTQQNNRENDILTAKQTQRELDTQIKSLQNTQSSLKNPFKKALNFIKIRELSIKRDFAREMAGLKQSIKNPKVSCFMCGFVSL
jgi:hypothetical protein